ncbi:hypothetical protein Q6249_29085, partial [Klebsiella pneumoniae]|uniref:hypothetical protein n=1 Tax=Klebsiella pneumoniae TaxID=573 RepID=UPI0027314426
VRSSQDFDFSVIKKVTGDFDEETTASDLEGLSDDDRMAGRGPVRCPGGTLTSGGPVTTGPPRPPLLPAVRRPRSSKETP